MATRSNAQLDLRRAINAVSDVIQNRPQPLREFDQIYMKAGDMVLQTSLVAQRFADRRLIFIGDGDAISLCLAYLMHRQVLDEGPSSILVLDFDERIVNAVARFADRAEMSDRIKSRLYNCIDPLPEDILGQFNAFYTNPPWGASNDGESVKVFAERGMEACGADAVGVVVIADDKAVPWSQRVLAQAQRFALDNGFFVQEMQTNLHEYHLDDAPDLKSCNLFFRSHPDRQLPMKSYALHEKRLEDFYGREQNLRVKYVRDANRVDYGKAVDGTYQLELLGDSQ
ncbi:bis-aminopropyl spermidine synthase family protein [Thiomonas sp. FB-Cd]|uniref:bis-aminopropyl spermidine synthase family protein n=1 Tax=Thiomonas sp. FB-Cd TaxID=1158292 RepID=UPI0004DEE24C|nr:bis-aminopropyl spermidine synthase family protein [Thiomonas sp. FB-Cd]